MDSFSFGEKILYHPRELGEYIAGKRPFPILLEVDLTDTCNHRCKFCYTEAMEKSRAAKLDTAMVLTALQKARKAGCKAVSLTGGGEPLVHRDFARIAEELFRMGFDLGLMTNGALMTPDKWDQLQQYFTWVRVSVGAGDRETYREIHGVDNFNLVMENLKHMAGTKHETTVGVRVLVTQDSVDSILDFWNALEKTPIDYLQFAPDQFSKDVSLWRDFVLNVEGTPSPWPIRFSGFNIGEDTSGCSACHAHGFQGCIKANGDFIFCKNARQADYKLGNINQRDILDIWNRSRTLAYEKLLRPDNCGLFCKNMSLNRTVERIKNPPKDIQVNFVN